MLQLLIPDKTTHNYCYNDILLLPVCTNCVAIANCQSKGAVSGRSLLIYYASHTKSRLYQRTLILSRSNKTSWRNFAISNEL